MGEVATPFQHRSYAQEKIYFFRYYYRYTTTDNPGTRNRWLFTIDDNDSYRRCTHTFPVVMRGTPAVTVSFYSSFGSGRGTQHINCHGTDCYVDGESQYAYYTDLVADAEL